ncbi:MAG: hypothetical protein ACI4NA_02410 [Succinivibrio sp.]
MAAIAAAAVLCSCSIEKDDQEARSAASAQEEDGAELDPASSSFRSRSRQCVRGSTALAPQLLADFKKSMDPAGGDGSGYLALQDPSLTLLLRKCLRKYDIEEGGQLLVESVPDARECARIARDSYIKGRTAAGAYWLRQVVNLLGRVNGYEQAGEVFVQRQETRGIGARMLSAAARMGSREARMRLLDLVSAM